MDSECVYVSWPWQPVFRLCLRSGIVTWLYAGAFFRTHSDRVTLPVRNGGIWAHAGIEIGERTCIDSRNAISDKSTAHIISNGPGTAGIARRIGHRPCIENSEVRPALDMHCVIGDGQAEPETARGRLPCASTRKKRRKIALGLSSGTPGPESQIRTIALESPSVSPIRVLLATSASILFVYRGTTYDPV